MGTLEIKIGGFKVMQLNFKGINNKTTLPKCLISLANYSEEPKLEITKRVEDLIDKIFENCLDYLGKREEELKIGIDILLVKKQLNNMITNLNIYITDFGGGIISIIGIYNKDNRFDRIIDGGVIDIYSNTKDNDFDKLIGKIVINIIKKNIKL
jgi:hypothetical protein